MTTTLDPNNKSSTETLSAGNLTATSSGIGTVASNRVVTAVKSYFEAGPSTLTGNVAVGLVNRSYNMAGGHILGTDANGVGYKQSGAVVINGATVATIQTYAAAAKIGVAFDCQALLIWFTTNGTTWNNDVIANQNPVGNVGGISLSTMTLAGLFAAISGDTTGAVWNAVFSAGSFNYTPPTGYSSLDASPVFAVNVTVPKAASYSTIGPVAYAGFTPSIAARGLMGLSNGRQLNSAPRGGQFSPAGAIQHVSGLVEESGSVVAGKTVRAYDSVTGEFLGFATSAGDGSWSIPALGRVLIDASARDDPNFDGIIHVRITPV